MRGGFASVKSRRIPAQPDLTRGMFAGHISCMLQPTSTPNGVEESPAKASATPDPLDIRIAELHEALRTVIWSGRRQRHPGALDKAALTVLHVVHDREPTRAADLAASTGLDASTISRHIKELIDQGYIEQSPDPDDARARLLSLSPAGVATLERVRAMKVAQSRAALASWAESDIDTLTTLLRRLGAALEPEDS